VLPELVDGEEITSLLLGISQLRPCFSDLNLNDLDSIPNPYDKLHDTSFGFAAKWTCDTDLNGVTTARNEQMNVPRVAVCVTRISDPDSITGYKSYAGCTTNPDVAQEAEYIKLYLNQKDQRSIAPIEYPKCSPVLSRCYLGSVDQFPSNNSTTNSLLWVGNSTFVKSFDEEALCDNIEPECNYRNLWCNNGQVVTSNNRGCVIQRQWLTGMQANQPPIYHKVDNSLCYPQNPTALSSLCGENSDESHQPASIDQAIECKTTVRFCGSVDNINEIESSPSNSTLINTLTANGDIGVCSIDKFWECESSSNLLTDESDVNCIEGTAYLPEVRKNTCVYKYERLEGGKDEFTLTTEVVKTDEVNCDGIDIPLLIRDSTTCAEPNSPLCSTDGGETGSEGETGEGNETEVPTPQNTNIQEIKVGSIDGVHTRIIVNSNVDGIPEEMIQYKNVNDRAQSIIRQIGLFFWMGDGNAAELQDLKDDLKKFVGTVDGVTEFLTLLQNANSLDDLKTIADSLDILGLGSLFDKLFFQNA
jgi:hypothetical protein